MTREKVKIDLSRVARCRATGWSWSAIAKELKVHETTIARRVRNHAVVWNQLLNEAERAAVRECAAEALSQLRLELRAEQARDRRDAAAKLLRHAQQVNRAAPTKKPAPPDIPATVYRIADYVHRLTDEQLNEFIAEIDTVRTKDIPPPTP